MRFRQPRRGVIAILMAVSLLMLLMVVALTADGGLMIAERRQAQAAADAAALAGAAHLYDQFGFDGGYDKSGDAAQAVLNNAADNGYNNDGKTSIVTVRMPGQTYEGGPNHGTTIPLGRVEVIIQSLSQRVFSSLFGTGDLEVTTRAVAQGIWIPPIPQIIVFHQSDPAALLVTNNVGTITATGPVVVNSNHSSAMSNLTTATFTAPEFRVTGNASGSFTGTMRTGTKPTPDPFAYLPAPTGLPVRSTTRLTYNDANPPTGNLLPGVYQGGISISGSVSVTMESGLYYIQGGGFLFGSLGNLIGNGVMIYNDPGTTGAQSIFISGTVPDDPAAAPGTVTLSPLTTGPYQGMLVFQRQDAIQQVTLTGNGNTNITGALYCADANLQITCRSYNGKSDVIGSQYMCKRLRLIGSSDLILPVLPTPARTRIVGLGE